MNEQNENNVVLGELKQNNQTDSLDIPTEPAVTEVPKEETSKESETPPVEQKNPETLETNYGVIPPVDPSMSQPIVKENKPNRNKLLIIILIIVFVLAGGAFLIYHFMFDISATTINTKIFTQMQNQTHTLYEKQNEMTKFIADHDNIKYKINAKVGEFTANIDLEYAEKNSALAASLDIINGTDNLVNLNGIVVNNQLYYRVLKDSNHYFTDGTDYTEAFKVFNDSINKESYDYSILFDYLGKSLNKNVPDSAYTKKLEKVEVNGKNYYAVKYSTVIDSKEIEAILKTFKEYLKQDEKFKNYVNDIIQAMGENATVDDLIDQLDNAKNTKNESDLKLNYTFYLYMGKIVKISLISEDLNLEYTNKGYQTLNLEIDDDSESNNDPTITDVKEPTKTTTIIYVTKNNDKYNFSYTQAGEKLFTGEINGKNYNLSVTIGGIKYNLSGALTSNKTNDKISNEITFNISSEDKNSQNLNYEGKINLTLEAVNSLNISEPETYYNVADDSYAQALLEEELSQNSLYNMFMGSIYPKSVIENDTYDDEDDDYYSDDEWEDYSEDEL